MDVAAEKTRFTCALKRRLLTKGLTLCLWQVEGAFVMGMGYCTTEQVVVDPESGRLLTEGTWEYKIPTAAEIPQEFNVSLLEVLSQA